MLFPFLILSIYSATAFEVHRLIQYEQGDHSFGSWKNSFSLPLLSWKSQAKRRAVIVRYDDILQNQNVLGDVSAAVILLSHQNCFPPKCNRTMNPNYAKFEKWLISERFNGGIYFAWETPELNELYQQVLQVEQTSWFSLFTNHLTLIVTPSVQPLKVKILQGENIMGSIPASSDEPSGQVPCILIVTHYDAYSPAPTLSRGLGQNGSSLLVFVEILQNLLAADSQPEVEILFLLTCASGMNHKGLQSYLSSLDQPALDSIKFALYIDTIDVDSLNLHFSRDLSSKLSENFLAAAETAGTERGGIQLKQSRKKLKLSEPSWPHEVFATHEIPSATLSASETPEFISGSNFDYYLTETQKKSITSNAKILTSIIHKITCPSAAGLKLGAEPRTNIDEWESLFFQYPRHILHLKEDHPVTAKLVEEFKGHLKNFRKMPFTVLDSNATYYKEQPADAVLTYSKGVPFDVLHGGLVALALHLLYRFTK